MTDAGIILVSNYTTALTYSILPNVESFNDYLESFCIIVGVVLRTKTIRAKNQSGQGS